MSTPIEHSTIVALYAAGIAAQLGWSGEDLAHIRIAAMLHDIGKVTLPDRILQKPDSLDAANTRRSNAIPRKARS